MPCSAQGVCAALGAGEVPPLLSISLLTCGGRFELRPEITLGLFILKRGWTSLGYPKMAAALNATGRPIAFSCSWPAYEGGLPPKVSHSLHPPGSAPRTQALPSVQPELLLSQSLTC